MVLLSNSQYYFITLPTIVLHLWRQDKFTERETMDITLQEQLQEINNSTLHNMRFLLESYSNEVLEAIDQQATEQTEINDEVLTTIRREVSSVIRTLRGIETVINHHVHTKTKEAS